MIDKAPNLPDTACITQDIIHEILSVTGSYQLEHFRSNPPGSGTEKNIREMVSEIDINSEKMLKTRLKELLPEADFFGEESEQTVGEGYTWVVDPLDGTTNYLSGYDHWSISVGLVLNGETCIAGIYKPSTREFYYAEKGGGAFRNGKLLNSLQPIPIQSSLIATGFPYRSPDTLDFFFKASGAVLQNSRGIRRTGSAALDLAYIAAGFFQGFWEVDLQCYDVAAALLLLRETGAQYSTFQGNPYRLFTSRTIVAGFPGMFGDLQGLVSLSYPSSVDSF